MQSLQAPKAGALFALLDDTASGGAPYSHWYTGYAGEFFRPTGILDGVDGDLRAAWRQGLHTLIIAPYEFGEPSVGLPASTEISSSLPGHDSRPCVLPFRTMQVLSPVEADRLFDAWHGTTGAAGLFDCVTSIDHATYTNAVARIRDWITASDTYKINYTHRLRMTAFGAPATLYRHLCVRQPMPYGTSIGLPEGAAILSCSPGLFFSHRTGQLVARPMRDTAPASDDVEVDEAHAIAPAVDEKNRAENLMIVDLLCNDLGRLTRAGSVCVPALFEVTPFGSVPQMASTVEAEILPATGFADCLCALFPYGSITGVPKQRTMEIIKALEPEPCGLYAGAIGWINAPADDRTMGNACFSAVIRALVLSTPGTDGLRCGEFGIGSGIVHDSIADDEYAECQLKARFVTALGPGLPSFETMRMMREGVPLLDWHLAQLERPAAAFGFPFDHTVLTNGVARAYATLEGEGAYRMRLLLAPNGSANVSVVPLLPLHASWDAPVRLLVTSQSREITHSLPTHKTTLREDYGAVWQATEHEGAFDAVFFNADGTLAEGGRGTLLIKLDDAWWIPPLSAEVLLGVMRAVLLRDASPWLGGPLQERLLTRADVARAEAIAVRNALCGMVPAHFEPALSVDVLQLPARHAGQVDKFATVADHQ